MKFHQRLRGRAAPSSPATANPGPLETRIRGVIDDALAAAGLTGLTGRAATRSVTSVIDAALTHAGLRGPLPSTRSAVKRQRARPPSPSTAAQPSAASTAPDARLGPGGRFLARSFAGAAGTLAYKLYVPAVLEAESRTPAPLLVMLHGCGQSPDDFAAGTRMNALAERHGVLVAYPAQSPHANGSNCWNWFRPQDQRRDAGEPALIAAMTRELCREYRADPDRVYVAGLSAGAAMAVVLGRTHPDLFAAVGAHSGLPYRAAHDVGSAFAAMHGGARAAAGDATLVPTIVFHGDRDHTVVAANGDAIVAGVAGASLAASAPATATPRRGRAYTRTDYRDADGRVVVEDWRVHGGGHAWMGGSADGSYTDPQGPDASAEMLRFFLQHAR